MKWLQERGVVHLDLAPRNILLTHPDEIAKISDFGLSRTIAVGEEASLVLAGLRLPLYLLPPELWRLGKMGSYTDVWSFGILLWDTFTGGWDASVHLERIQELENKSDRSFQGELSIRYVSSLRSWYTFPAFHTFQNSCTSGSRKKTGFRLPGRHSDPKCLNMRLKSTRLTNSNI